MALPKIPEVVNEKGRKAKVFVGKHVIGEVPVSLRTLKIPLAWTVIFILVALLIGRMFGVLDNGYFQLFLVLFLIRAGYWIKELQGEEGSEGARNRRITTEDRLERSGINAVSAISLLFAWYFVIRWPFPWPFSEETGSKLWVQIVVQILVLFIAGILIYYGRQHLLKKALQATVLVGAGVVVRATLFGWVLVSTYYLLMIQPPDLPRAHPPTNGQQSQSTGTKAPPKVTIAVALSGGGYRAATIHTGVLKILDKNNIPIHYLSTVSGGSIIGGYYALGHSPDEFQNLLESHKPGLPNDLSNIFSFFLQIASPCWVDWLCWTDSEIYASHFSRVYFGDAQLSAVKRTTLLVNVTSYKDRWREVFVGGGGNPTPDVRLADAVAASGAFPGAFELKKIKDKFYMDGGVVENLGVEGLRTYLNGRTGLSPVNILIISDASKNPTDLEEKDKVLRVKLASEATNTTFDAAHNQIYRLYTDNAYDPKSEVPPLGQPYPQDLSHVFPKQKHGCKTDANICLFTFVLNGTSLAERNRNNMPADIREQAEKVARFSTLKELTKEEVQMGVNVGEWIAQKYVNEVLRHIACLQRGFDPRQNPCK